MNQYNACEKKQRLDKQKNMDGQNLHSKQNCMPVCSLIQKQRAGSLPKKCRKAFGQSKKEIK